METRQALITGGDGFVGSALANHLAKHGWHIYVYDNLSGGKGRSYSPGSGNIELVTGDILDIDGLTHILRNVKVDVLFHLAAVHYVPYCNAHPLETLHINVEGTAGVLEACKVAPPGRMLFASTAAVYPAHNEPLAEELAPAPVDVYGLSKYFGERLVQRFASEMCVTSIIVRLFNVYGPGETNLHLIPTILNQVMAGCREVELGNLESKRDYVYVEDVARALHDLSLLAISGESNPVCVNLATGVEHSVLEVLQEIAAIVGYDLSVTQKPLRFRPNDRPHLCGDVSKLRSMLGWIPSTPLMTGLKRTLEVIKVENRVS